MNRLTKNDRAWQQLFAEYPILEQVEAEGSYEITARRINAVRESRLMAKFDQSINLPHIFRTNRLAILPVSRSSYRIGRFDAYQHLASQRGQLRAAPSLPWGIECLSAGNLYSESAALHYAYLSGIIDELLGEHSYYTLSGRMSTASFNFTINDRIDGHRIPLQVTNSQCEIDAGFETGSTLLLVEAKNFAPEDFNIRQLYYPYRLWSGRVKKKVLTALLICSNDILSFYLYDFAEPEHYNSLRLVERREFMLTPERITRDDIRKLLARVEIVPEPELPFPQADKFEREIDLLSLLAEGDRSRDEITRNYQFGLRQCEYYTSAAIYLGLAQRGLDEEGEVSYSLTAWGQEVMSMGYRDKYLSIAGAILSHEAFNRVCRLAIESGCLPDRETTCQLMRQCPIYRVDKNSNTLTRRAQTVLGWVGWILGLSGKLW